MDLGALWWSVGGGVHKSTNTLWDGQSTLAHLTCRDACWRALCLKCLKQGKVVVVVVVVVFIGEARKAKASPGSRAYGHAPLGEFSAPGATPRLILRPRATFEC